MRTYNFDLQANTEHRHALNGRYFRILESTGVVYVRIDNGPLMELSQGIGPHVPEGFESLVFMSAAAQEILVAVSKYQIDDSRLSLSAPVDIAKGATIAHSKVSVGTSNTLLAAASATRKAINIKNADTADTLYVGATGVTSSTGFEIQPGESYAFTEAPTAAFYGIAGSGTVDCRILEEAE